MRGQTFTLRLAEVRASKLLLSAGCSVELVFNLTFAVGFALDSLSRHCRAVKLISRVTGIKSVMA